MPNVITFTPHKRNSWETAKQRLKAPLLCRRADFKGQTLLAATCRFYQGGTFTLRKAFHNCPSLQPSASPPEHTPSLHATLAPRCPLIIPVAGTIKDVSLPPPRSSSFTPYCLSTILVCLISLRALPSRLSFQSKHKIAVAPLAGIKLFVIYPPNKIFVHSIRNTLTFCSTRSNVWF